ncbi:MAG: PorV/PorQ family protein [Candidatus Marinimicrobia bacterium]|nr:PorV/PorQ family protein [Candidatus Neomarinimicrobiota bacterium]
MMKKQNFISITTIILLLVLYSGILQAQTKVGTSAFPFLGIGAGPKALSMGTATVATAGDASSLFWNPGAIAHLERNQISFSNMSWLVGTTVNYFGGVLNLGAGHFAGISYYNLDYGDEKVTTVEEQTGTGEYWSASDMAIGLSYARLLTDRFSLGGSLKYIQSSIWHETAKSMAVDIGLLFKTQLDGLQIGIAISNYGTDAQWDGSDLYQKIDLDPDALGNNETLTAKMKTEKWALPLFFRLGLAYSKDLGKMSKITLATDAFVPSDNEEQLNFGLEWLFFDQFALRAGYKGLGYNDSQEGLTLGGGLKIKVSNLGLMLDYSYQEFEYFDNVQTFGIGIYF